MERPTKRPRLSLPEQGTRLLDDLDVQEARARNDLRLKTLFEGIFEKYGRDFSDIGDEIDLQTGEIVVNNGHVVGMRRENDLGETADASLAIKAPIPPTRLDCHEVPEGTVGASERVNQTPLLASITNVMLQNTMLDSPVKTKRARSGSEDSWHTHRERSSGDSLLGAASGITDNCEGNSEGPCGLSSRHKNAFMPDINTKFTTPKQNKPVLNSQAAVTSIRSAPPSADRLSSRQGSRFMLNQSKPTAVVAQVIPTDPYKEDMPIDPLWRVPDVDAKFTTPKQNKPILNSQAAVASIRSASPPGAESLWALPAALHRKANTDVRKKTNRTVHHRRKRKQPPIRDWNFAMLQDDSDSDDPLQEDVHRPPTPKSGCYILKPHLTLPSSSPTTGFSSRTCNSCGKTFSSSHFLIHLDSVLDCQDQSDGVDDLKAVESQQQSIDSPIDMSQPLEQESPKVNNTAESNGPLPLPLPTPSLSPIRKMDSIDPSSTYSKKRSGTPLTPDDVRLVIEMRKKKKIAWKELIEFLPGRSVSQLFHWNSHYWNRYRTTPPRPSNAWTEEEQRKLKDLAYEIGLSWDAIRIQLPGRSKDVIEYEMTRIWAGDEVWNGAPRHSVVLDAQEQVAESKRLPALVPVDKNFEESTTWLESLRMDSCRPSATEPDIPSTRPVNRRA